MRVSEQVSCRARVNGYVSEGDLILRESGMASCRFLEKRASQVRGVSAKEVGGWLCNLERAVMSIYWGPCEVDVEMIS